MAEKKDIHVDLLAIDMSTGKYWLDPTEKHADVRDKIRKRHRDKWLAEQKRKITAKAFDPDEPRDEQGRWTEGGGGGIEPEAPASSGEKLLLVSEQPNQEKLDRWHKQIADRQEELNKQGQSGEHEDDQLNGMELSLNAYSQEDQKNLDAGRSGLNTVYDGDNKLLAAAFTDVKGDVAKIAYFGAVDADAHLKVLDQITKAFGDKVSTIEVQRWKDDPSLAQFEAAGFKEKPNQAGLTNLSAVMLEKRTVANPPSFEHMPVPIQLSEGTGNDFKSELAGAISAIPARTLKTMADEGIKIRAGTRMTELNPELKGEHPRGWPAGTTWDSTEGGYFRGQKTVNVTESYRPVGRKEFVRNGRIRGVVLHESGHAFDHALDTPSSTSNAFVSAYADDVRTIPKAARGGLRYFLQKGKAGRSETFAETFAWHAGAGSGRTDLRQHFPQVSKLIKQAMDRGVWLEPMA